MEWVTLYFRERFKVHSGYLNEYKVLHMEKVLVSIIIPVYNAEKFLPRCLASIVHQTYENIEIIIVNDGSTDGSLRICEEHQIIDERISIISQKNAGVSASRNMGIECALGEYLLFVDSDDYVDSLYVEKMVDAITSMGDKPDLIVSGRQIYYENEDRFVNDLPRVLYTGNIINDFEGLFSFLHAPWGKMFKAEIIKKNEIQFPVGYSYAEDQIFNYEYLRYSNTYNLVREPLYTYRINGDSLTNRRSNHDFIGFVKKLDIEWDYLKEKGIKNYRTLFLRQVLVGICLFSSLPGDENNYKLAKQRLVSLRARIIGISIPKRYFPLGQLVQLLLLKARLYYPLYVYFRNKEIR